MCGHVGDIVDGNVGDACGFVAGDVCGVVRGRVASAEIGGGVGYNCHAGIISIILTAIIDCIDIDEDDQHHST